MELSISTVILEGKLSDRRNKDKKKSVLVSIICSTYCLCVCVEVESRQYAHTNIVHVYFFLS